MHKKMLVVKGQLGGTVRLRCGSPSPTDRVRWFKDNVEISSGGSLTMR